MNYFEEKHNKYEAFSTLKTFYFYILSKLARTKKSLKNLFLEKIIILKHLREDIT